MQPSWQIVLKDKKADSCTAKRHSSPGIREELLKSRQELLSLLCHSWVTPVKCWFANLQLGKLAAVFTVKYLQTIRAQHSNKSQIKPCRVHRGSSLSFALFFRDELFHARGEVEHGARLSNTYSTAWGMLILLTMSLSQMSPIFMRCICWKSKSHCSSQARSHTFQGIYCSVWSSCKTHKNHHPDTENNIV